MLTTQVKNTVVGCGLLLVTAGVPTWSRAQAQEGDAGSRQEATLNGLGDELNRTGRFATMHVTSLGAIAPVAGTPESRDDLRVRPASPDVSHRTSPETTAAPAAEFQYARALNAVDECRYDVARRRGVVPQTVAAGTVTLRWTIDPSGGVRDAEVTAASGTDAEVAACAKRVLTGWQFLKPRRGSFTVERSYTFRSLP